MWHFHIKFIGISVFFYIGTLWFGFISKPDGSVCVFFFFVLKLVRRPNQQLTDCWLHQLPPKLPHSITMLWVFRAIIYHIEGKHFLLWFREMYYCVSLCPAYIRKVDCIVSLYDMECPAYNRKVDCIVSFCDMECPAYNREADCIVSLCDMKFPAYNREVDCIVSLCDVEFPAYNREIDCIVSLCDRNFKIKTFYNLNFQNVQMWPWINWWHMTSVCLFFQCI